MRKLLVVLAAMLLMIITGCTPGGWGDTPASSAKAITAYSLNGVVGTIDEAAKTISVIMPSGTDLNGLIATFTTTGFNVKVGSTVQKSGTTPNDFTTNPMTYKVTAEDGSTQDYTVTVATEVYQSFILSNEGGGLISQMVAAGYGNFSLYNTLLLFQDNTNPSAAFLVTPAFLSALASCPADSEIFTTPLRDYLDSTPQSVTAVSKAAVMRAGISINIGGNLTVNTSANTFILSNEGGGLISQLIAAGYGNYNLYDALQALRAEADPSISSVLTDAFLTALASCPAGSAIFTHKLSEFEYIGSGAGIAISDDGTVTFVSVFGRTYYTAGYPTLSSAISGVGNAAFTHSSDTSSPLTSWVGTGGGNVYGVTYNVFAIGWMPSTTTTNTAETFILSNEDGGIISQLIAVGYGDFNLYQALVAIQSDTDPSTAGIITNAFLAGLSESPASSAIFTHKLSEYTGSGVAVAISTDGTVQTVSVYGRTYFAKTGTATLSSNISGVGSADFTYSTNSPSSLMRWIVTGKAYDAFAIGWVPLEK
ncbi:MAG: hypothetical protein ABSF13_06155 [Smithella sp.]|jgi:hypothetical protein